MNASSPSISQLDQPEIVLGGRWHLDQQLGEGGTARVFVAHDEQGLHVAVKMLHPELLESEEMRARFVREVKVGNLIEHPGVVKVIDDGNDPKRGPFIVMELLEGESIEDRWLRKGKSLPVSEVLWIADQTLDVLASAHAKGIVHRDIKPENLFLTHDRKLKVLDFGIAGLRELSQRSDTTRIGTTMGTPQFMPPEQARGDWKLVGVQTDLWSVGATMYTLISGHLVREERELVKQILAAASKPVPSLRTVAPDAPGPIIDLVDLALRFDVGQRWPNAGSMQTALRFAFAEWKRGDDEAPASLVDWPGFTEPRIVMTRPDAPPMSLRRPGQG